MAFIFDNKNYFINPSKNNYKQKFPLEQIFFIEERLK